MKTEEEIKKIRERQVRYMEARLAAYEAMTGNEKPSQDRIDKVEASLATLKDKIK